MGDNINLNSVLCTLYSKTNSSHKEKGDKHMYIVAKDGSGDFTSIQQAIDAIPAGGRTPTILLIRMNEYQERVVVDKDNVRIIGEARDRTIITAKGCALDKDENGNDRGTFLSATFIVMGNNVEVENLTIRNDAGAGPKWWNSWATARPPRAVNISRTASSKGTWTSFSAPTAAGSSAAPCS